MKTYKYLKVSPETHKRIKKKAVNLGVTIDEFLQSV